MRGVIASCVGEGGGSIGRLKDSLGISWARRKKFDLRRISRWVWGCARKKAPSRGAVGVQLQNRQIPVFLCRCTSCLCAIYQGLK